MGGPRLPLRRCICYESSAMARRVRVVLLILIGALFAASIPWYRSGGAESAQWWGLPDWVLVALLCYIGAALLNCLAWLLTDFGGEEGGEEP